MDCQISGVVFSNGNVTELLDGPLHNAFDGGAIADIGGENLTAAELGGFLQLLFRSRDQSEAITVSGQTHGGRPANAATGACDDGGRRGFHIL
jgi:hypothetical protein